MYGTFSLIRRSASLIAVALATASAVFLLASCDGSSGGGSGIEGPPRDTTPVVLEATQPGVAIIDDGRAALDYSNAAEGYICVMSYLETRVKVLVDVAGAQYQYSIDTPGVYVTIPLSQGNGQYAVGVWENISGDSYAAIFSQTIDVALNSEFGPFLYPNQFVNFANGDEATSLGQQLAEGSVTDVDVLNNVYNWVCSTVTYDMEKATTVASGYLPVNANTIAQEKGICFDYAVLTASMLRSQQVPCKLVIGYAGSAYHAWMEVYCVETGTVLSYTFDGNMWVRMDPTFDAAAGGSSDLSAVIGDGTSYQPMFYY